MLLRFAARVDREHDKLVHHRRDDGEPPRNHNLGATPKHNNASMFSQRTIAEDSGSSWVGAAEGDSVGFVVGEEVGSEAQHLQSPLHFLLGKRGWLPGRFPLQFADLLLRHTGQFI